MKFDPVSTITAISALIIFVITFYQIKKKNTLSAGISFSNIQLLASPELSWKVRLRWLPNLIKLIAIIFLLIAFARPQKGQEVVKSPRKGIAIQMVIDRSSSMLEKMSYKGRKLTRLEAVKQVFNDFILGDKNRLRGRKSDMIGLTSFAGFVEENVPLTLDHKTVASFAKMIKTAQRYEDGTMIGDAIYQASLQLVGADEFLRRAGNKEEDYQVKSKIIILLTDGQQTRGGKNPIEAARFAKENKIKVYTVAITDEGENSERGINSFFSFMKSPLDTRLIEETAKITGGTFEKASSGEALLRVYQKIDQLEKSDFDKNFTIWKEKFSIFLLIGLILMFLDFTLRNTVFLKIP